MEKINISSFALEYRYYNFPVNFPIFALLGPRWFLPDDDITFLHFHNAVEIGYCYEGEGYFIIENTVQAFHKGDIVIIPPNTVHRSSSKKGTVSSWEYLYIDAGRLLQDSFICNSIASELDIHSLLIPKILPGAEYPAVCGYVQSILNELRLELPYYQHSAVSLCVCLFIEMLRIAPSPDDGFYSHANDYLPILPAIIYIENHYAQPLKIETLAEECQLSLTHFRRLFQKSMHTSPLEYLNRVRIHESCIILHNTEKSILDVSLDVGFTSVSSYNRQFQRVMKTTPLQWRTQSRNTRKKGFTYSVFDY